MSVAGHRPERIAEEIRNEISLLLAGELKDPRVSVGVTVTEVRVSPDLRQARIYLEVPGTPAERAETLAGLGAARGFIRHELIEQLQLRRAPEISFILDETEESRRRIDELLREAAASDKP